MPQRSISEPTSPTANGFAVQCAYDAVGRSYDVYADGDGTELFPIEGPHARADSQIWQCIDEHLRSCRARGLRELHVLDAGCGPGTWLARVILRAAELGFDAVEATGFDLSRGMTDATRERTGRFARWVRRRGTRVQVFVEQADACDLLARLERRFDLTLCLYSVLNHVSGADRPRVAAELSRLSRGLLLVSVRAAGSTPTIYVDRIERALDFRQDHVADRMDVDLLDGRHLIIPSHTFRTAELDALFAPHLADRTVLGLDVFHARFARDSRWNPADLDRPSFLERLDRLEREYATDPDFIDHATHILLCADASAA